MECATIKKGIECSFMTKRGCSYSSGICQQIVEQCNGCNRQAEFSQGWYCTACPEPSVKWRNGDCNLASHVSSSQAAAKTKLNPLKASKRGSR
jgi:hypothetical protein